VKAEISLSREPGGLRRAAKMSFIGKPPVVSLRKAIETRFQNPDRSSQPPDVLVSLSVKMADLACVAISLLQQKAFPRNDLKTNAAVGTFVASVTQHVPQSACVAVLRSFSSDVFV